MKHILVVDHEKMTRDSLSSAFQSNDIEVIAVEKGGAALKVLGDWPFDFCFLDIQLHDMPGIDVMRSVSQLAPRTKIIMMAGSSVDETTMSAVRKHAFLFLAKPFDWLRVKCVLDALPPNQENAFQDLSALEAGCSAERRHYPRQAQAKEIVYVTARQDSEEQQQHSAYLIDISDAGTRIRTACRLEPGTRLRFKNSVNEAAGVVRWVLPDNQEDLCLAGIQFVSTGGG